MTLFSEREDLMIELRWQIARVKALLVESVAQPDQAATLRTTRRAQTEFDRLCELVEELVPHLAAGTSLCSHPATTKERGPRGENFGRRCDVCGYLDD